MLSELLERQRAAGRHYSRILYVGDGRGDFCPSALLLHGGSGGPIEAADAAAAAAAAAFAGGEPAGSSSNRVFAREQYPDGQPCSLWAMLRNEAGGSSVASASGGSPAEGAAEEGGVGVGAAAAVHVAAGGGRVLPWSTPEQLAALLARELQLE